MHPEDDYQEQLLQLASRQEDDMVQLSLPWRAVIIIAAAAVLVALILVSLMIWAG